MKNKHPGYCHRCLQVVEAGTGYYKRTRGFKRVFHPECLTAHRQAQESIKKQENTPPDPA